MGLKDDFIAAADEIFETFADFVKDVDYLDSASTYSPIAGSVTTVTPVTIEVVLLDLNAEESEGNPTAKRKALARNLAFRPEAGRRLKVDGWNYAILSVSDLGSDWVIVEMMLGAAVPVAANP